LDVDPLDAVAHLTAVDQTRGFDGLDGDVKVCVGGDDRRRLASELEVRLGDVWSGCGQHR
jgi:hypothetical protein